MLDLPSKSKTTDIQTIFLFFIYKQRYFTISTKEMLCYGEEEKERDYRL